jgi:dolichyl-phosphate-mannose-protein mannosyltransferase
VNFTRQAIGWLACCLFILLSLLLIPHAGIQDDESLFALPLWLPVESQFEIRIFHHTVALMIASYLGTLKTCIYWPIFKFVGSGVFAVRVPMLLAGAASVYFFFKLLLRCGPPAAACLGALLLASEPTFLLTNTFDWGPVALEHLLLITGGYALVRFVQGQRNEPKFLAIGFFLFGLALWNKALFLWALSGMAVGAATVFWPEVRKTTRRHAVTAAVFFLAGALPFVVFNLRRTGATVSENAHIETAHFAGKWLQLGNAANGSSLFAFMAAEDYAGPPKPMLSFEARVTFWIHEHLGEHRKTGFFYVFGALLLLVPWWWRSLAARFSLVFLLVAWGMMAGTKGAGGAAHHLVLLWPFPLLFAAQTVAQIRWQWLKWATGTGMVLMNLLVVNQYLYQFNRNGAAGNFTDALFPLAGALDRYRSGNIYTIDWGMFNSMEVASRGTLPLRAAGDPLMTDSPTPAEQAQLRAMLADAGGVFLGHVPEREAFRGTGARLDRFAESLGYHREVVTVVADSNGRPVFEIFQFRRL